MSSQASTFPAHPNHMPTASMIGGTAVTTPLATRSRSGIVTGRTADSLPAEIGDVIRPPVLGTVLILAYKRSDFASTVSRSGPVPASREAHWSSGYGGRSVAVMAGGKETGSG